MADVGPFYQKTKWKDHIASPQNTYTITDNGDGTFTIVPAGTVLQQGTPQDQTRFNNMEDGITDVSLALALLQIAFRQFTWQVESEANNG